MFFSPFLAARYLKPKRTFVSIITVISILGVALGVWAMIVVIAVFTGYGERIKESILGFEPHLVVDSGAIIEDWLEPYEKIEALDGVVSVTPYVMGQVIMDYNGMRSAPRMRGIIPPEGAELERMRSKIAKQPDPRDPNNPEKALPRGDFFGENDFYSAVIGDGIAEGQNIQIGDKILLHSPRNVEAIMQMVGRIEQAKNEEEQKEAIETFREMTAPQELTVTGIFDSGSWELDSSIVFVHLETAQVLYGFDMEECHGIAVRTDDAFKANRYQEAIHKILPEKFRVLTWGQMNKTVFDAVAAERQAMYLILLIIMIVSSFGIMSTTITVTVQKQTEIGLLKALGSREGQVAWVFLLQGMIVGLVGVAVGMAAAELTLYFRNDISSWVGRTFGVDIFSAEIYGVEGGLPAVQTFRDLAVTVASALTCCTLAALIPALIAASFQPAKALRGQ